MDSDPVLDRTIDKILAREKAQTDDLKLRLEQQLLKFERTYQMNSEDFQAQFEAGSLGDEMDFIEWSATIDMLRSAEKLLAKLDEASQK